MTDKLRETRKKRYYVYRKLGYDSKTASALSSRKLDVSELELSDRTGKLKQNKKTKIFIAEQRIAWDRKIAVDTYIDKVKPVGLDGKSQRGSMNDRVYTPHGTLTHDKRYKGETGKIVSIIKHENKLSTSQAYYFFYFMRQSGLSYKETKKQLLSSKDFEEYDKSKKKAVRMDYRDVQAIINKNKKR